MSAGSRVRPACPVRPTCITRLTTGAGEPVGGRSGDPKRWPAHIFHPPSRAPPIPKWRNNAIPRMRGSRRAPERYAPATFSGAPTHPRTEAGPGGLHRPRTITDTGPDRNSKGRRPGTAAGITATPRGSPRAEPVPTPGFRWKNMELRKPAPAAPGPHRFGVSRTTPGSAGVFRVVGSSSSSPLIPLGPGPGFRRTASATPLHPPLRLFRSAAPPTPPLRSLSSYSEG